ncbi:MAG: helix-turn-helix domain-containing protein [Coriobacteriia bacterium]|nr:helix-turn-helix domain-containing protein [Coriobacteriia bacterium]
MESTDARALTYACLRLERGLPVSPKDASYILGLSTSTVRNLITAGQIESIRLSSGRIVITAVEIERYLNEGVQA